MTATEDREAFSVYVHLPYCARRCPYCDFNTYVVRQMPEERYVETLVREIAWSLEQREWSGRPIRSVFFGGGTPSLFSPASVGRILETLATRAGFEPDVEITLEANPGTLEGGGEAKLRGFRAAGINRVSFGAQSFDARHLATLGRLHSADETIDAVGAARRAGFGNVSCDLIYGVPGQTLEDWARDIRTAIDLGTGHVSAYCLTYEKGTPMTGMKNAGLVTAADEDTELAMFRLARELFPVAGLVPYEISNFARPGLESRHNLAYWTWKDYLGLGAGAHGFSSATARGCGSFDTAAAAGGQRSSDAAAAIDRSHESFGRRYANIRLPELYMSARDGAWHTTDEHLTREMAMSEYLMVGLRLEQGIDTVVFERTFAALVEAAAPKLETFLSHGLLERRESSIVLTTRGLEIADTVLTQLVAG
jgi:putative oxygen-independent coproporphyrinogen III oxidase